MNENMNLIEALDDDMGLLPDLCDEYDCEAEAVTEVKVGCGVGLYCHEHGRVANERRLAHIKASTGSRR